MRTRSHYRHFAFRLKRVHAGEDFDDARVHQENLHDHGHVSHHDEPQKGPQHIDAVAGDNGADESEHAEGRHQDDAAHDGDAHVRHGVANVNDRLGFLPSGDHAEAEHHGDDDDLQHGGVSMGWKKLLGNMFTMVSMSDGGSVAS